MAKPYSEMNLQELEASYQVWMSEYNEHWDFCHKPFRSDPDNCPQCARYADKTRTIMGFIIIKKGEA